MRDPNLDIKVLIFLDVR